MTHEKDIVLLYFEDKPVCFARIENISEDYKKNWYHVKLFLLQVPVQVVTWILKDVYIDGEEFTMNGKRMRLERVECPDEPEAPVEEDEKKDTQEKSDSANVISFNDLKKK